MATATQDWCWLSEWATSVKLDAMYASNNIKAI